MTHCFLIIDTIVSIIGLLFFKLCKKLIIKQLKIFQISQQKNESYFKYVISFNLM